MFNTKTVEIEWGGKSLKLETGRVARQADGAVIATLGETVVLCAVTAAKSVKPGQDFFPLTVHYQEKFSAAGRIPGGFFKRERGATEKETLTSRLIDRPIRALFPQGFYNEILVIAQVMSYDGENEPDILAMIAASAALTLSGVPFMGPIGAARVAFSNDGEYILNPTQAQIAEGRLDLVVAGTRDAVMMVESEAKELSEDEMLGAVMFAHRESQKVIEAIIKLAEQAAKEPWELASAGDKAAIKKQLKDLIGADIDAAYKLTNKQQRQTALNEARVKAAEAFAEADPQDQLVASKLAWRALRPMLPSMEDFPYTVRVLADITESNGSSSMATVCGGSLALMDAGVPLKRPVAGIAMGLILEGKDFAVISDILGDEDHLGDMDFKVAGTSEGVTSLQMDIKAAGITEEIMKTALAQAKDGRAHILGEMAKALDHTREELSAHAPRIETMSIPKDKIREVIGTGGKVIREIVATTGAKVDIDDEGVIKISSSDLSQIEAARQWIRGIVAEPEPGTIYTGKVASIVDFGAFVTFMPGKDGLVHVSEIRNERVENVRDVLSEGQEVKVKLLEVDQRGKVRLSMRLVDQETGEELPDTRPPREPREGGDRGPRGDRHRGGGGGRDRDRGPRREGGGGGGGRGGEGRGGDRDRGPRGGGDRDRGPRREREGGGEGGGTKVPRPSSRRRS